MVRFLLAALIVLTILPTLPARAAPRMAIGLQDGWAIGGSGDVLFDPAVARSIRQSGAGWVRIHFRLGPFPNWTDRSTGTSALDVYDQVIANARAQGLRVLGLINHESYRQNFVEWTANNAEVAGGDGDNPYVRTLGREIVPLLAARYPDIDTWEIWNEPNAFLRVWQAEVLARSVDLRDIGLAQAITLLTQKGYLYDGGSYIYPSNLAWLLRHSAESVRDLPHRPKLILGGVLSQDIGGQDGFSSGADYVSDVLAFGRTRAGWAETPVTGVGQHLYIDQGRATSAETIRGYLDRVYAAADLPIWVTEVSWGSDAVTPDIQATNLRTAFDTMEAAPFVAAAFWFNLRTIPVANLYRGLLDPDGRPMPAHAVFTSFAG